MWIDRLRAGERVVGTMFRVVRSPAAARMVAHGGLDFFMLDLEHGPYSLESVADIFAVGKAAGAGCCVRVPELSKGYVSRAMDCGAEGVMVPMVDSASDARLLAHWSRYAPAGARGLGSSGGHTGYSKIGPAAEFMSQANSESLAIAQIETRGALAEIDEIAAVEGIDVLLIGPNDLAISLGCAGELESEAVREAIGRVAEAAATHGKVLGMHGPDWMLEEWLGKGLRFVMSSLDANLLLDGMSAIARRHGA